MYQDINEYIQLSKTERTQHLDLTSKCIEIGGESTHFRGILAVYLMTTIPKGMKIHLCHACHNSKCSNPLHLYWGTPKENHQDGVDCGVHKGFVQIFIDKYGSKEKAIEYMRENGKKYGHIGGHVTRNKYKGKRRVLRTAP